jgi:hypothetical protein
MKLLLLVVGWFILLAVSWPLALAALVLAPVLALLALPFLLLWLVIGAFLALLKGMRSCPRASSAIAASGARRAEWHATSH